jgi:fucose 4-O-acetylase-like acetyltransferase
MILRGFWPTYTGDVSVRNVQVGADKRVGWIDAARGLGIILVVYAHAARALVDILPARALFDTIDRAIYAFHMPLFFFLAGLVATRSLGRGKLAASKHKLWTVAYPYLLWSLIYGLIEVCFSRYTSSPLHLEALARIHWEPVGNMWFLYALFMCHMVSIVIWPSRIAFTALFAALFVLTFPYPFSYLHISMPYFLIGVFVGRSGVPILHDTKPVVLLAGAGTILFIAAFSATEMFSLAESPPLAVGLASAGIAGSIGFAALARSSRVLLLLGQASLSIYVMHTIFSAGARIISSQVLPIPPLALLAVTFAVGLVVPVPLYLWASRLGIALQLGIGGRSAPTRSPERLSNPHAA